jgi:hypothetical protein
MATTLPSFVRSFFVFCIFVFSHFAFSSSFFYTVFILLSTLSLRRPFVARSKLIHPSCILDPSHSFTSSLDLLTTTIQPFFILVSIDSPPSGRQRTTPAKHTFPSFNCPIDQPATPTLRKHILISHTCAPSTRHIQQRS